MTTPSNVSSYQSPPAQSKSQTILIVLLVLIGVVLVFLIGLLLGRILSPKPEGPTINPPPPPVMTGPHLITNDYVNVRSGPGLDYPVYGVTNPGMAAQVSGVSEDGKWWVIVIPASFAPDGLGWISANYVTAYYTEDVPVYPAPPVQLPAE